MPRSQADRVHFGPAFIRFGLFHLAASLKGYPCEFVGNRNKWTWYGCLAVLTTIFNTKNMTTATTITRISNGLKVPILGEAETEISSSREVTTVALVGDDYIGMKPTMSVREGDQVKLGQVVFEDKKTAGVNYTSPASGRIIAVHRGAKRKFESLVIEVNGDEEETFASYSNENLLKLDRSKVVDNLAASGLWTAFRTRPFSRVPLPTSVPHSIFVNAAETNPLAPDPSAVLADGDYVRDFIHGLRAVSRLTDGKLYLCRMAGSHIPGTDESCVATEIFDGPHPAGLTGTHIHFLDPVNENKTVWHIGYQDVIAIGHLFLTGRLLTDRIVSIAGPGAKSAVTVRTRLGASIDELTRDLCIDGEVRIISGSVLSGRRSEAPVNYLGRYHQQISILAEGRNREFLGWAMPGMEKFSVTRAFASCLSKIEKRLPFTTSTEGSKRAIVPIGNYEKVMPLDLVATPLLKSLLVQDTETAQALGCLELDEEDLALCTFVCPGKNEYGPLLRQCLNHIEREG